MSIFLESKDIILSPISGEDLFSKEYKSWINDQMADVHTQHALFPQNKEKIVAFFESRATSDQSIWLSVKVKPDLIHIGNIDISSINWVNRTGVYNVLIGNTSFQGKGLGYQASMLILNHAFNRLNLERIQLGVEENNLMAIALYEKLGFVKEGILRRAVRKNHSETNVIVMGLLYDEFTFDTKILSSN